MRMKIGLLLYAGFAWASTALAQSIAPIVLEQRQIPVSHLTGSSDPAGPNIAGRKLRGCIRSVNSGYILQQKSGRKEVLEGPNLASHVGHLVSINGTSDATAGKTFIVSKIQLVSDRCSLDQAKTEQAINSKPSPYHHK